MLWYVIFGFLAAFGALCALWVLFGLFFPGAKGGVLVCLCRDGNEDAILRRYTWLAGMGLLRCPLVLLDSGLDEKYRAKITESNHNIKFFTLAEFTASLQKEGRRLGGAGNGDAAGHHCSSGISEL